MSKLRTARAGARQAAPPFVLLPIYLLPIYLLGAVACGGADEVLEQPTASGELSETESEGLAAEAGGRADSPATNALGLAGPSEADEPPPNSEVALALQVAKRQWASEGVRDYTVKVSRSCFCAPRPEDHAWVTVEDGRVVSALGISVPGQGSSSDYDTPIESAGMEDWYTVHGMFARIETNLESADRIDAVFDAQLGYPSELAFDYRIISAEEGELFTMWDFMPTRAD
jgi:Family of unknown function (DUF6174)